LSLCNSIAGAYAEKSPVVVISGAPGLRERFNNPLLHHRVKDFRTQLEVFRRICCADTDLNDPQTAFREIDRILAAVARYRRPGYIELPRDMVDVIPDGPHTPTHKKPHSDAATLAEAVMEAARLIAAAKRPIIIAGVEIHRFGLQAELLNLAENAQIPITATMLGKSVINECHPLFAGIYEGALGREEVTRFVEESDCVLLLGEFMSDINMGIFTANLVPANCIYATSELLRISHHEYPNVLLGDFIAGLCAANLRASQRPLPPRPEETNEEPQPAKPDEPITIHRLIASLNRVIDENMVVIADPGDSLFASSELVMHEQTDFISPAYYTSLGFAVPAALGVMIARPKLRPIVMVGDGAFQMTGMELSTVMRHGLSPIVIVLDNQGYGTERLLHPGNHEFNEILPWHYHRLPQVFGGGMGYEVRTKVEFDHALQSAIADTHAMSLIQVHLDRNDRSATLERLAKKLSSRI
jgi:indolepyruvate decarboxylase